jgi:dienelactone hydrolase
VIDGSGNVYVTGYSYGGDANYDYATIKYDTNGNQLWSAPYNGTGNSEDYAFALVADKSGNIYVTGQSMGVGTNFDYATIKYIQRGYCTSPIAGDLNNDCKVDFKDIAILASHWVDCNYALDEQCR